MACNDSKKVLYISAFFSFGEKVDMIACDSFFVESNSKSIAGSTQDSFDQRAVPQEVAVTVGKVRPHD